MLRPLGAAVIVPGRDGQLTVSAQSAQGAAGVAAAVQAQRAASTLGETRRLRAAGVPRPQRPYGGHPRRPGRAVGGREAEFVAPG